MIKFRVWNKLANRYCDKSVILLQDGHVATTVHYGFDESINDITIIEPSSGLLDVKGVEIYAGDIVRIPSMSVVSDVKYMPDGCTPEFEVDRQKVFSDQNVLGDVVFDGDIKVIGNIHENPELLEGLND